jgi:cytochrome c oxidase subunit 2
MAAIIFVLVEGLLFFAVFRFRNRPPESAMQFHGNTKLELAWTAAPAVILAVLLGFTLQTMGQVKAVSASNVLNVKAIGHQWWWEFPSPDQVLRPKSWWCRSAPTSVQWNRSMLSVLGAGAIRQG